MNVLFIAPYPKTIAPSQRFRFEHYLPEFDKLNIRYTYKTFVEANDYKVMFQQGRIFKKFLIIAKGFANRFALLFSLKKFDFVYIHREAALLGPPLIEWLIAKVFRKKIIYDFDDAIWIPLSSDANPIAKKIKCTWKVAKICKWSHIVSAGNDFLAAYASQYSRDVRIIPTVVDTVHQHNRTKNQNDVPVTVGWTGTFTNFLHLPLAIPAIKRLQEKYNFNFIIIADKDPQPEGIRYQFMPWKLETEIDDLLRMNIGIMPLIKTDVQLGKCAFKAIQYMALGIPAVVTPIGANCQVVADGRDGFWADNEAEWYHCLETLLLNTDLRISTGSNAQKKIIEKYSVTATAPDFISLFYPTPLQ
ncbi:MAG: glycosyltransferase family 4 protein [Bacteroidetes bacterium]|nr:glycosyltransferase family 4 protein [Bacteroidota bacterium]